MGTQMGTQPARPRRVSAPPTELAGAIVSGELDPEEIEEIAEFEVLDEAPAASSAGVDRAARSADAPSPSRPADPTAPPQPASTHKDAAAPVVLVVEDDASIRAMIVRALGLSCTVFEAEDGEAALALLARIPPPACVVSDWMMPRMDGLVFARHVRADKNLKRTPLILLTAKNHPLDIVQGINAGARHYLAKPFKMKELLDKVGSVLAPAKK
jgi:CheY-like chemotaxis protein